MGDAFLAHERAEDFKVLDNVMGKVGELIHRRSGLNQGLVIEAFHPAGDRIGIDHEGAGCLGEGPGVGGHEFEDGKAFNGRVVWALMWRGSAHAGILDAHDFFGLGGFGNGLIAFGSQPDALEGAIGGPGAGMDERPMGERNDVEDVLANVLWK